MPPQVGTMSGNRQRMEEAMKATAPGAAPALGTQQNPYRMQGQGGPGDWGQGNRAGQFGFPQPGQLPSNIGDIRGQMQRYQGQPTDWQNEFNQMNPGFSKMWQGVFNMPGRGEDPNAPFDFNVGPRMASAPLGQGSGPSAPWAGWQPASEEWT